MLCETAGDSEGMSYSTMCGGAGGLWGGRVSEEQWSLAKADGTFLGRVPAPLQNLVSGLIKAGAAHNIS